MLRNIVKQPSTDVTRLLLGGEVQTLSFTIEKNDAVADVFVGQFTNAACIGFSDHGGCTRDSSNAVVNIGSNLNPTALRWMDSDNDLIADEDVRCFIWSAASGVSNYDGSGQFGIRAKRNGTVRIVQDAYYAVDVRVENETRATFYTADVTVFSNGGPQGATWKWNSVSSPFLAADDGKTCTLNFYIG